MMVQMTINGKSISAEIRPDQMLLEFLREQGCLSVKRGCGTTSCGMCTVLMDGIPVLSCTMPAYRAAGHTIETLEGLQEEAESFIDYIANEGADQCGFCNSGTVVMLISLLRENPNPTDEEVERYLLGNLCRCSGYEAQHRGVRAYLAARQAKEA